MAGTLYLVPTPIGNLGDLSQRIIDTLAQADFIAAEDTRVSLKILNHLSIKKPMVSLSVFRTNSTAIQQKHHRQMLHAYIMNHLIVTTLEKTGVYGNIRPHTPCCKPRRICTSHCPHP